MIETMHSERFIKFFAAAGVVLILLVCCFLTWNEMRIETVDISGLPVLTLEDDIAVKFDEAFYEIDFIEGQRLSIRGWAVVRGKETRPVNIHVLLRNRETHNCFQLPTEIKTRSDVTELFAEDYTNYDSSGFIAALTTKRFDFPNNEYDVLILYELADGTYVFDTQQVLVRKEA